MDKNPHLVVSLLFWFFFYRGLIVTSACTYTISCCFLLDTLSRFLLHTLIESTTYSYLIMFLMRCESFYLSRPGDTTHIHLCSDSSTRTRNNVPRWQREGWCVRNNRRLNLVTLASIKERFAATALSLYSTESIVWKESALRKMPQDRLAHHW